MDSKEIAGLLMGMQLQASLGEAGLGTVDDNLQYMVEEFDVDKDGHCTREEFRQALSKWVAEHPEPDTTSLLRVDPSSQLLSGMPKEDVAALQAIASEIKADEAAVEELEEEEGEGPPLTASQIALQSAIKLGAGVTLCAAFSDPLVDALNNLSK